LGNKCTGGHTVPSVMSPCLPQWVVLSERETLFRTALDTTLTNTNAKIHYILHEVQCRLFSLANKTAVLIMLRNKMLRTGSPGGPGNPGLPCGPGGPFQIKKHIHVCIYKYSRYL